ncbi:MAG: DUF4428 domain-containing protein [Hungatella sp.]
MGLFSNKAKGCPICGGATPRLLAKKFEGQPICSDCANNIMSDDERVKNWTLEDLREHLNVRAENKAVLESFMPTRTVEYEHEVVIDDTKRIFYISRWSVDNPPVFHFDDILGFTIEMGYRTVESWSRGMMRVPFQPLELSALGGIAALAEMFVDEDDKDSEYENLKVTLKVNTPYLQEYELCDLSVGGRGRAEYAHDLSYEMCKVNTICDLIVSLTLGA